MLFWELRTPKLLRPRDFGFNPDGRECDKWHATDLWYSYFINEWIPCQPDYHEVMVLFIDSGFDPLICVTWLKAHNARDYSPNA